MNPVLPVAFNTELDLAREGVVVGSQGREERAEGIGVEVVAAIVVVVERIEGFGAELDAEAFGDSRVLDGGRIEREGAMLADLARARRGGRAGRSWEASARTRQRHWPSSQG